MGSFHLSPEVKGTQEGYLIPDVWPEGRLEPCKNKVERVEVVGLNYFDKISQ